MIEYNTIYAKLSDLQLIKLKITVKKQTRNSFKNECQNF